MEVKRLTRIAILTAVAMTIFTAESYLPPIVPIPGVKLGLANIITLFALCTLNKKDALMILLMRISLGGMFSGQGMSIIYSLSGGICCWFIMGTLVSRHSRLSIPIISVCGAVAHNIGQISVAKIVLGTSSILYYFPILVVSGIVTGYFTGSCVKFTLARKETVSL